MFANLQFFTDSVQPSSGTRAAPTAPTEGFDLGGVSGHRVIVSADSGQTLDGSGTMQAWVYIADLGSGRWCRDPDLDWPITAAGVIWSNVRDRASPDFQGAVLGGRVCWAASGVGVSSGNVTVQVQTWSTK